MKREEKRTVMGVITSRQCPECGHHEVGFTTEDGVFHPLRPGTIIQTRDPSVPTGIETQDPSYIPDIPGEAPHGAEITQRTISESLPRVPWLPDPLWGNRELRLKFGILLETLSPSEEMTQEIYWKGYMEKLALLISKEQGTPIPVILDRVFTAPHLASGEPPQIAESLWENLEEVRRPVRQVGAWLEKQDGESMRKMIHPLPMEALEEGNADRDLLRKELEELSLEDFLEML